MPYWDVTRWCFNLANGNRQNKVLTLFTDDYLESFMVHILKRIACSHLKRNSHKNAQFLFRCRAKILHVTRIEKALQLLIVPALWRTEDLSCYVAHKSASTCRLFYLHCLQFQTHAKLKIRSDCASHTVWPTILPYTVKIAFSSLRGVRICAMFIDSINGNAK